MKNLVRRIVPLVLTTAILAGCSTFPNYKPIEVGEKDGYYAESQLVSDELDLIASVRSQEATLLKTPNGYVGIKTGKHLQSAKTWEDILNDVCRSADKKGNKHITNEEAQALLDLTYRAQVEPVLDGNPSDLIYKS